MWFFEETVKAEAIQVGRSVEELKNKYSKIYEIERRDLETVMALCSQGIASSMCPNPAMYAAYVVGGAVIAHFSGQLVQPPKRHTTSHETILWEALWGAF